MAIENKKVKEKARELGARFVGIGSADRWKEAPETMRPEAVLPKAKSVIVIGVPIPKGMVETIPSHLWSREHGHLMGSKVDEITDELANWLEDQRFKSTPRTNSTNQLPGRRRCRNRIRNSHSDVGRLPARPWSWKAVTRSVALRLHKGFSKSLCDSEFRQLRDKMTGPTPSKHFSSLSGELAIKMLFRQIV